MKKHTNSKTPKGETSNWNALVTIIDLKAQHLCFYENLIPLSEQDSRIFFFNWFSIIRIYRSRKYVHLAPVAQNHRNYQVRIF